MCYEDIRIGYRRWAKYTQLSVGNQTLPANKNRVSLRISITCTAATEQVCLAVPEQFGLSNTPLLSVNASQTTDEIWFERHGSTVQGAFNISNGGNSLLTEIIDNDLPNALMQGDPIEQGKYTQYR